MAIQISSATTAMPQAPVAVQRGAPAGQPVPDAASLPAAASPPSADQVKQAMSEVQKAVAPVAQDLQFSIDKDTGETVIKVLDAATNTVIRQIPAEEILNIAKAIDHMQGLLLKQKA